MLLSGGLALVFADYWGWKTTYEIMALLMLLCMLPSLKTPNLPKVVSQETFLWSTIKQSLGEILQRDHVVLLLAFIACYKLGDAFALTLMTNFLLKGLGFTLTEVGLAYKFVYFIAAVLGAFVGGAILLRLNIYRALLWFGFAQSFSILTFLFLAWVGKNYYLMISSIFIETFCNGLSTAAFITFLMSLCDRRYSATQYALFSALAFIGRTFLGPVAGYIVLKLGWIEFYLCAFLLSLPCLLLLLPLGSRVSRYAPAPAE
jgi:PAT family beta-lactamase induction signal transducer AmpG